MEPAVYELDLDQVGDVERVLEQVNSPTAGPVVTASVEANRVVFVAETWRPILVSRVDAAIGAVS